MRRVLYGLAALLLAATAFAQSIPGARPPVARADAWWANAVFYEVFVRSFQDSDGDGVGDLRGLRSRLDYLRELGVNALWLMPIHPSPSYHGYDVTDYEGVNPDYGTLEDFDAFLAAAHERGMRVILDWVPNHSSREHPWFRESLAPGSDKRDWYLWRQDNPGWRQPFGSAQVWHRPPAAAQPGQTLGVVFPGTIGSALGGNDWDPNGTSTRATQTSPGVYELVAALPRGRYEYKVAVGGSWSVNYGAGNRPDGPNIALEVPADGTIVRFVFDANARTVRDSINDPTLTAPAAVPPPAAAAAASPAAPGGDAGYYYGVFWEGMPDLNWRNPDVKEAMNDAASFWLERGVDGFRVDAVRYLLENPADNTPDTRETLEWVRDFVAQVKGVKSDAAVVTEVWTGTETVGRYFLDAEGQDMGFNFDLQRAIPQAVNAGRPAPVSAALEAVAHHYPEGAVDATFLANHDLVRPLYFGSTRYRVAASLLLTLPGTPFLYYGEEIAMPNGPGGADEAKRTPMRWTAGPQAGFTTGVPWQPFSTTNPAVTVEAQRSTPGSLWTHYRNLIRLRQSRPALRAGGYAPVGAGERLKAFVRHQGDEELLVVVNLDSAPQRASLNLRGTPLETARGPVRELTLGKTLAPVTDANAGAYPLVLSPGGLVILEVVQ